MAHRLGLIPIKADPSAFEWKQENSVSNERNCVVFKLDVACEGIRGKITDGKGKRKRKDIDFDTKKEFLVFYRPF